MADPPRRDSADLSFGPFTLAAGERLLTKGGIPVELGARALDILVALATRPNEVISKTQLLAWAWPDVTVDEGSLRFQIANLRKALGDGRDGARYIATLAGRGYCFVAPVTRSDARSSVRSEKAAILSQANLPNRLTRMVGRGDDSARLSKQLAATRFVTIVGTGGVGKTTLAVAVGHDLIGAFAGAVHFVDLGALGDPGLVAPTVATTLGLSIDSADAASSLVAYLKDKRVLLILDTCEHLIEGAAALASRLFDGAPEVHILATSREALRVEGEHVYKLAPLACPPDDTSLTVALAQTFPAAQLFIERAAASGAELQLTDADAALVGDICRKLDGVPLAIELAAGRVDGYGLQRTAALLDQHLTLVWPGLRTAPPRQRTLQAALDWSYELLSETERAVLRRLAVFVGHFTIEAALDVVTTQGIDQTKAFQAIDGLVAKSMVAARPAGAMMRYRLLDTTRAYALQTGIDAEAHAELAARHASYFVRWLEQTGREWATLSSATQRALHLAGLANVRAALEWSFGPGGNAQIGVRLAAAAAPVFLAMSLLTECHRWSERALAAIDDSHRGTLDEMHLQAALGVSLMFTRGGQDAAGVALDRSFAIAERQGDALDRLQVLGPLQMFHLRTGAFSTALRYSEQCSAIARTVEDSDAVAMAHAVMGISLHLSGELERARIELEHALRRGPRSQRTSAIYLGFDGRVLAEAILARTLWLQGHPLRATEHAHAAVESAARMDHPLTLSIALIWAVSVLLWAGDLQAADEHIDRLFACAEPHALGPYLAIGAGFKGELAIRRGSTQAGVDALQASLAELHASPYELLSTPLNIALVQGLAASGQPAQALALAEQAIAWVDAHGDLCYLPELLRVKGKLLLAAPQAGTEPAEACFRRSIELSHRQGTRAWELRTAIDWAAMLAGRGQPEAARARLHPVLEAFTEASATDDLRSAAALLARLSDPPSEAPVHGRRRRSR